MSGNSKLSSNIGCLRRRVKSVILPFLNDCTDVVCKKGFSRQAYVPLNDNPIDSFRARARKLGVPETNGFFSASEKHCFVERDVMDNLWLLKEALHDMTSDGGVIDAIVVCDDGYVMFGRR